MKRFISSLAMILAILSAAACDGKDDPIIPEQREEQKQPEGNSQQNGNANTQSMTMTITAGGKTITYWNVSRTRTPSTGCFPSR